MDRAMHRQGVCGSLASAVTVGIALCCAWPQPARAADAGARPLIGATIDETIRVRLEGNTRPEANPGNDRGRVPDSLPLEHIQLLLRRPEERELALQNTIADLHDRSSPLYHRWLTAAQLGERFGPAQTDIAAISGWLTRHGLRINAVLPSTVAVDFSGTAGAIRGAFHTEIHSLSVAGRAHIANMTDPEIPAALAPAVAGIVSLNDFRPHPLNRPRAQYTVSSNTTLLAPADLAAIYNLNPLFSRGYIGQNQTVVVIEDSDVYSTADWTTFRSTFGLAGYTSGSFTQVHPAPASGPNNCRDPGVVTRPAGSDGEAILDAEWSSAAAPGAAIVLASCADASTTFGGLIALENLINAGASPPAIISISYGDCEADAGAGANAAYSATYQQAVAEGVSVFVAAGDEGAAGCDPAATSAIHGVGVSGMASTPYDVAVGGTDFGDAYTGTTSAYWSAANSAVYGSALSYVPEIPWNDSCAGALLARYEGYSSGYGSGGFCNSSIGSGFLNTTAGSGGPSGCASGSPATAGVVGGSCAGTPKPSWQSGFTGIPSDGVRDLPDVALFAGNGLWGHYYVYCWSNVSVGGKACTGAPSAWSGAGGTSFAAPILAGIQALVNQSAGGRQGNPNYVYYPLAASQRAAGLACNASSGNQASGGCVFYDVTAGDMDLDCQGSNDCYLPSGTYGALSTSDASYGSAYGSGVGWDFATGLGSINAYNLLLYWTSADLALSGSGTATAAGVLSYTLSVYDNGPQSATGVVVSTVLPSGLALVPAASSASCTQVGQTVSCAIGAVALRTAVSLTIGVQASAAGPVSLAFTAGGGNTDINPADSSTTISLTSTGVAAGASADAPLPPWAYAALGMMLLTLGMRRLGDRPAVRKRS